ncbi:hypothetical protein GH714_007556 [Hevea brasiliensis]|uniref:Serine-threonine/tyrosine-protein kinase catalytic domain-containing protein n=1 Tax=Hevea brasiliensis TaxID=3981 RepID=A0A6A6MTS7_HEVBR|nr:hypothetical protein GH714_007556 [Hevea brasiliensis]
MSYSFQDDFDKSQQDAESTFNNFAEQVNSTMKWGLTESIVMGVVITVAIVAIVYAIIDCLKKAGSAIPEYARISTSDKIDKASTEHVAITKDKEKAERMVVVALQCIQHSPDARPLMSDVVKMLEGSMEVLQQPQNPFDYLESNRPNIAFFTGSDEDSSTQSSALTRHISEPAYLVTRHEMEIELAATS